MFAEWGQNWGEDYVLLALQMDRLQPGFVDMCLDPDRIRRRVDLSPPASASQLSARAGDLVVRLDSEIRSDKRRCFLRAQLRGMETTLRKLRGEHISFSDEIKLCYDIEPEAVPQERLRKAHDDIASALRCSSAEAGEALQGWKRIQAVDSLRIRRYWRALTHEARRRSSTLLPLPEGEQVALSFVDKAPWSGYNWYLGDFKSRVDVNLNARRSLADLPYIVCHETYPGHHTERAIKERELYRRHGYLEAAVLLYGTPECVISEGIGQVACELVFGSAADMAEWCNAELGTSLRPKRDGQVVEALRELDIRANVSLLLHRDGVSRSDAVLYSRRFGLQTAGEAEQTVAFCERFGAYAMTYVAGRDAVRAYCGTRQDTSHLLPLYGEQLTCSTLSQLTVECNAGRDGPLSASHSQREDRSRQQIRS